MGEPRNGTGKLGRRKEDKLPWFPFWINDWDGDEKVKMMGPAARGIYLSLLIMQWHHGSVPADVLMLLRLIHMPPDPVCNVTHSENADGWRVDVESCVERVLECFPVIGDGRRQNQRLEEIREEQEEFRDSKSEAGKHGNDVRWGASTGKSRAQLLAESRQKGRHTSAEWAGLVSLFDKCPRCDNSDSRIIVKDHIIPIYQGGSDGIENIQPLCRKCNSSKGKDTTDHRPRNWRELLNNALQMPSERLADASQRLASQSQNQSQIQNKESTPLADSDSKPIANPPAGTLPTLDGKDWVVSAGDLQQWQELYPAVDARQEFRAMKGWLIGNPTNRKTRKGMNRFINNWLAKSQNRSGSNGNGQVSKKQAVTDRNRQKIAAEVLGVEYCPDAGSGGNRNRARVDERREPHLARAISAGDSGSD